MEENKIDTTHWEKYYKKKPKGMGLWAFSLNPREIYFVAPYQEAVKLAIKTAQERKYTGTITLIL